MREVSKEQFVEALRNLLVEVHYFLPEDVLESIKEQYLKEQNFVSRDVLNNILLNAKVASSTKLPLCQDTGIPQIFLEIGRKVVFDFDLNEVVSSVVESVYNEEKLRRSGVIDPLIRKGSKHIYTFYTEIVEGESVKISVLIRGGGSENMSATINFLPSSSADEVKNVLVEKIVEMLPFTCAPVIVGIGVGGSFEQSSFLAKKSLLRKIGERNKVEFYSLLEDMIIQSVNVKGCGALGLGGGVSALDVFIEVAPTHIATLPVSVILQCHSVRRGSVRI